MNNIERIQELVEINDGIPSVEEIVLRNFVKVKEDLGDQALLNDDHPGCPKPGPNGPDPETGVQILAQG